MKLFVKHFLLWFVLSSNLVFIGENHADKNQRQFNILPLDENLYLHVSYKHVEGFGWVSSNGVVVFHEQKAYIIDTPWGADDTQALVAWIREQGMEVAASLSTHSHEDRTGGIGYLNSQAITTYTSALTDEILKQDAAPRAQKTFADVEFVLEPGVIEIFYPGKGHTQDNVVVWLPHYELLIGGCLVRSLASQSLGYVGEASIKDWPKTMDNLLQRYPQVKTIIPGHGQKGTVALLTHTKALALTALKQ